MDAGLAAATGKVVTNATYLGGKANAHLGIAARHGWEFSFCSDDDSGVAAAVFGLALERGHRWRRKTAAEIVRDYRGGGAGSLIGLDGSFVLALVDERKRKVFVVNDVSASIPVFWAGNDQGVGFAPEGKSLLAMLEIPAVIDEHGLLQLMNTGHAYGDVTLLAGVRRLEPAQIVEVELDNCSVDRKTYWNLPAVSPTGGVGLDDAADRLFDAVCDTHDAVSVLEVRDLAVALTGGYDSRVVLALLAGRTDIALRSFTWGALEDIPGSDPAVARQLAAQFGSVHDFRSFNATDLPRMATDWVVDSELLSDNAGYCAGGVGFLADLPLPELVLTGDHIIGLGAIPESIDEAVEAVTTVPSNGVSAVFSGVLNADGREQVREEFLSGIRRLLSDLPDDHPKAVQDHLYHRIHAPGWLFSPGYYKEPAVAAFRPLMLRPVLETVSRMPYRFRSDKIVFVRMLRRHLNRAAARPVASAFSLIDWGFEGVHNPQLRRFLEQRTAVEAVLQTPLGRLIDEDRLSDLRSRFFGAKVAPTSRSTSYVPIGMELRRWMMQSPALRRLARVMNSVAPKGIVGRPQRMSQRAIFRLLIRIALTTLFCEQIESGRFRPSEPAGVRADAPKARL